MHIEVKNLVKEYNKVPVVRDVSLYVNKGEIVGLLGPNGAGKTTTFYMIVGIEKPTSGDVLLDDINITNLPINKRAELGISYLAQESSIFRKLTVEDNIRAILETMNLSKGEQDEKINSLLEEFNITHIRHRLGMQLSGGERRRVEIARGLALNPSFILLDEPFAGIDPLAVADIQSIVSYLRSRGMGILITDHSVRETLKIVDRAYILSEGSILLEGTSEEIAASPLARETYLGTDFRL